MNNTQKLCPVCLKKNNTETPLVLKQIHFKLAVYLCPVKDCNYPTGHGWQLVERDYRNMHCKKLKVQDQPVKKEEPETNESLLNEIDSIIKELSCDKKEKIESDLQTFNLDTFFNQSDATNSVCNVQFDFADELLKELNSGSDIS